jgi:hypothetical protein
MSRGGIFLRKKPLFVRVDYDTSLVKRVPATDSLYTIRRGVRYNYWEDSHNKDTLVCLSNEDTTGIFELAYIIVPGRSNIPAAAYGKSPVRKIAAGLYFSLLHPFFFNARGLAGWIASLENLLLLCALLVVAWHYARRARRGFSGAAHPLLPVAFLSFALCEFIVIGFTAPNVGAIIRYRAAAALFILLAALYALLHDRNRRTSEENATFSGS